MEKRRFIGFHATSKDNVNKINEEGFIINKRRNNEWLGYGIYMFLYKVDADSWARGTYYCKNNPVIIKCHVEVEEDKYLDLDNPEEKNVYESYYNEILSLMTKNGKSITFKNKYEAMCWGLNIYKKDKEIDLIKYTFKNKRTKNIMGYGNTEYGYEYNEVQMCASRNEVIVKKEIC
mgnify:FL=1